MAGCKRPRRPSRGGGNKVIRYQEEKSLRNGSNRDGGEQRANFRLHKKQTQEKEFPGRQGGRKKDAIRMEEGKKDLHRQRTRSRLRSKKSESQGKVVRESQTGANAA